MKLLFAHGLASSGAYKLADTLRICLKAEVVAPDLPIDPDEALALLRNLCGQEKPDLTVGLSWGGFLVQQLRGQRKVLINPDLNVSVLLHVMKGEVKYLSPRRDGATSLTITSALCDRYQELEAVQFAGIDAAERARTLGFFAQQDELVHCGPLFEKKYPGQAIAYPGGHLPTFPEVKQFIAPRMQQFYLEGRL